MTNIIPVVQNQGKNRNGEVAHNVIQILLDNEAKSYIPDIYDIQDSIRKYVGYVGVPFRRSWYGQGVCYWFESGVVFESESSKYQSIKEFEKDLLEMIYDSYPEHEMVINGTLKVKVLLYNSQHEN